MTTVLNESLSAAQDRIAKRQMMYQLDPVKLKRTLSEAGSMFQKLYRTPFEITEINNKVMDRDMLMRSDIEAGRTKLDGSVRSLFMIHKILFNGLYPHAGEMRELDLNKEGSQFASPDQLQSRLDKIDFKHDSLASIHVNLNNAHPFYEGNGRSTRVLMSVIAKERGIRLDWSVADKDAIREASIEGIKGNNTFMEALYDRISTSRDLSMNNDIDYTPSMG